MKYCLFFLSLCVLFFRSYTMRRLTKNDKRNFKINEQIEEREQRLALLEKKMEEKGVQ